MYPMVLTAQETGSNPVYHAGGFLYRVGDAAPFDVDEVAQLVPGFEAGETLQEHRSLLLMAFLQLRKLEGLLLGHA